MDLLQAIVLGLVQGLTEFLPISSSAHLRVVPALLGWEDPGAAFTAVTQLGTEAAVLLYFRHDLWGAARGWLRSLVQPAARGTFEARLGWYLVVATIPIGTLGLLFEDEIETVARDLWLVGTVLIAFAFILLWADRRGSHDREIEDLSFRDGVLIGLAQSMALIPGVSRAGATLTAGMLLGLKRPPAARFSFLLAVPAVLASGFFQVYGLLSGEEGGDEPFRYVVLATVIAFAVGYVVIAWLLRYLAHHSLAVFVGYRVVLGAAVLVLVAAGAIS